MHETNFMWEYVILFSTIGCSLLGFYWPRFQQSMALRVSTIKKGYVHSILTSAFIHADWIHLAFNMMAFYSFAQVWNAIFIAYFHVQSIHFINLYFGSIVFANLTTLAIYFKVNQFSSLGASGGVSGLVFSSILVMPWSKIYVLFFPMPAIIFATLYFAYSIYAGVKNRDRINHWAHLAGALFGVVYSYFIVPDVFLIFWQQLQAV